MPRYTFKVKTTPSGQVVPETPAKIGQQAAAGAKAQQDQRKRNPANASQADMDFTEESMKEFESPSIPELDAALDLPSPVLPTTGATRSADRLAQARERARGVREGYMNSVYQLPSMVQNSAERTGLLMEKIREQLAASVLGNTDQDQREAERLRRLWEANRLRRLEE